MKVAFIVLPVRYGMASWRKKVVLSGIADFADAALDLERRSRWRRGRAGRARGWR